jgi:protein-tyrosine phosphatase
VIDLHCHILPGLDDGALDLADSVAMARQAQQDGISVICATPHIRDDHDVRVEELAGRVAVVQRELLARGVLVQVVPGGEVAQERAEELSGVQLGLVTLGAAGRWVLLEPAPGPLTSDLEELAGRLARRGLGIVIAHPERHAGADFQERLRALANEGCLIQWTAEFIAEASAGDLVLELAGEGLVHLLASDAHSSHAGRPVRLAAGYSRLAPVVGPTRLKWMISQAPRAIVRGDPVTPMP